MSFVSPLTRLRLPALNFMLLAGCFALGQGVIFLVQTGLVLDGALDLLAAFGLHFSFAILLLLTVDWGGATVLARQAALGQQVWRAFAALSLWRALIGLGLCGVALFYTAVFGDPFGHAYAVWAAPALVLWAGNLTGVLDGLGKSGLAGLSGLCPYLLSALALGHAVSLPPDQAGALLGGALSAGYVCTLGLQICALRRAGFALRFMRPSCVEIGVMARAGGAALLSVIPGQVFFRAQLAIGAWVLGPAGTALLYYAMQLTAGVGQVIGFARRVEFPALVAGVRGTAPKLDVIARTQRAGTRLAGVATLALLMGAGAVVLTGPVSLRAAGAAVLCFAATVFSLAVMMALVQGAHALGRHGDAARALAGGVVIGIGLSLALSPLLGLVGFALAALVSHVVSAIWLARMIGRGP